MSHAPHARAAHVRHANRAGGFGGLGNGNGLGFTFPGFGLPGATTETTTTSTATTSSTTTSQATSTSTTSSSAASSTSTTTTTTTTSSAVQPSSSSTATTTTSLTTTSTPSVPITTTYSGTALHDNITKSVTHVVTAAASSSPSASGSGLPASSNALVAPVIGGVAGGILGLAGLIFMVTFFLRRRRGGEQQALNFDPDSFRRSALIISDPPTHQETVARGFNPPPPVMMERRQMYIPNSTYSPSHDGLSPSSGNPLVFQAPFSPITPSATSPVSAYDHNNHWPAPVLTRNTSASSGSHHEHAQYPQYAQEPALPTSRNSLPVPDEYLDLERTSVTPYQAAQYVEISKHLNTEVPKGLDTPAVTEFVVTKMASKDAELPALPPKDPFADAQADADDPLPMVQELSFPSPPSPVRTTSARARIDSTPPTLPAITIQSRVSVASTYLSDAGSNSPFAPGFPAGQTLVIRGPADGPGHSPLGSRFPVSPSPLASSFSVPSPPASQNAFPAAPPAAAQPRPDAKQRQSVYTMYDPEDAYGGI
ncbi:hypothetical protein B0H17DRAFT_1324915 [Mycena rosella]|uniref:Uncharacterized protein n=1 Tax=Mycena rosella TaxID=1033263 RepID=A0AAD7H002_MYCRO|nr:hypothetical protein B0H17DRAFT_1324915 [Mycena rosella]